MQNSSNPSTNSSAARAAGRGGLAVLGAKVFFILTGLAQQVLLPRLIGLDGYGALARVLAPTNVVNNVVISSTIQGVSRAIANTPANATSQTLRRLFKMHCKLAVPMALAFFFLAPAYAWFQHAPHIVRPLQVVSLVILAYNVYAPLIGALNGQQRFSRQAALDVSYATLRTIGLLGLGYIFARAQYGILGACIGYALAAVLIVPIAIRVSGLGTAGSDGPTVRQHLAFIAPVALGQVCLQLLMQGDLMVLGHFASAIAQSADAADKTVGVYRACQMFAFLPFQLLISISFILFPMLAKAKAEQDRDAITRYVRTGMRLALVFACIMVATVSALAPQLLGLAFPAEVARRGASTLRVLAVGQGAFAIFYMQTTVLTSLARERVSALLTAMAAVLIAALSWFAGSIATHDASLLSNTAAATAVALAVASLLGATIVQRVAGGFVSWLTLVRVLIALAVTVVIGMHLPHFGKLLTVPAAALVACVPLLLLIAMGELGRAELDMVRQVLRSRNVG